MSGNKTESPIEEMMLHALNRIFHSWIKGGTCEIFPQYEALNYRLDFAVIGDYFKIDVECDGIQYHSLSEQVQKDKIRDRALTMNGFLVMRFTGSEIFRDAEGCARQVMTCMVVQCKKVGGR